MTAETRTSPEERFGGDLTTPENDPHRELTAAFALVTVARTLFAEANRNGATLAERLGARKACDGHLKAAQEALVGASERWRASVPPAGIGYLDETEPHRISGFKGDFVVVDEIAPSPWAGWDGKPADLTSVEPDVYPDPESVKALLAAAKVRDPEAWEEARLVESRRSYYLREVLDAYDRRCSPAIALAMVNRAFDEGETPWQVGYKLAHVRSLAHGALANCQPEAGFVTAQRMQTGLKAILETVDGPPPAEPEGETP